MRIINFSETNTVLNQFVSEIRDKNIQQDRLRFRNNIGRIGSLMAYEISKTLDYKDKEVWSCLGKATCSVPADTVVLCTILRAGLPFHQGFLDIFDNAENAFVSAYRKYIDEKNFVVHTEYIASPSLDGKTLIIVDPMLATGKSIDLAVQAMLAKGHPKRIIVAAVIAARPAFKFLEEVLPKDTEVYCAAIDEELNEHSYIVPGLGDAGDLLYGEKA